MALKHINITLAATLLFASPAASLELQDFETIKKENYLTAEVTALAIHMSYMAANAVLESRGEAPLFCQPERLRLTSDMMISMIDDHVIDLNVGPSQVVELVALYALMDHFPCSQ